VNHHKSQDPQPHAYPSWAATSHLALAASEPELRDGSLGKQPLLIPGRLWGVAGITPSRGLFSFPELQTVWIAASRFVKKEFGHAFGSFFVGDAKIAKRATLYVERLLSIGRASFFGFRLVALHELRLRGSGRGSGADRP
ncbi:MAG: hypothetical protein O7A65_00485, partial [Proteobacteria bacterium]|nr:hypothetical protein [Pseudomonadota bacterium]